MTWLSSHREELLAGKLQRDVCVRQWMSLMGVMHEVWFCTCVVHVAILSGIVLYSAFVSTGLLMTLPIKSWSKYYQDSSAPWYRAQKGSMIYTFR